MGEDREPGEDIPLFDLAPPKTVGKKQSLPRDSPPARPLWTEYKAALIQRYLYLFVQVTHHGTYIDGFAGPQYLDKLEHWAARLVLDVELLQHFHLFEISGRKLAPLLKLKEEHPGRDVNIHPVDFNQGVLALLRPEIIPERQATFCLIDQHTFECEWDTLKAIAAYKAGGYKIELFYFLGTSWLDRAVKATKDDELLRRWWGGEGYGEFLGLGAPERAFSFAKRLREELGYLYVEPWAIHEKEHGGRIMYFMVHASDHPDATKLMLRAYGDVQPHPPVAEKLSLF